jgi:ligand-binding sensor protein
MQYYQQEHVPSTGDDLDRLEQECEDAWQTKEELLGAMQEARLMSGQLEAELSDRLKVRTSSFLSSIMSI